MNTVNSPRMLRVAGVLLVLLGFGHLVVMGVVAGSRMAVWATTGFWAAVPLMQGPNAGDASFRNALAFWGGVGSFAVPLIVLGALLWWGAGRGFVPPAWSGWVLAAWFAVAAVLLVPSPMVVGVASGVLIVLAARRRTPSDREAPSAADVLEQR
ncbi:hypothetical protein ACFWN7_02200 [Agromyces sp. NPDC058484]|uniref:hypothetical protein n=1 Tax=Agromyces sp. NPDC058484 TaxID=3346524 RepID=UPI00365B8F62